MIYISGSLINCIMILFLYRFVYWKCVYNLFRKCLLIIFYYKIICVLTRSSLALVFPWWSLVFVLDSVSRWSMCLSLNMLEADDYLFLLFSFKLGHHQVWKKSFFQENGGKCQNADAFVLLTGFWKEQSVCIFCKKMGILFWNSVLPDGVYTNRFWSVCLTICPSVCQLVCL